MFRPKINTWASERFADRPTIAAELWPAVTFLPSFRSKVASTSPKSWNFPPTKALKFAFVPVTFSSVKGCFFKWQVQGKSIIASLVQRSEHFMSLSHLPKCKIRFWTSCKARCTTTHFTRKLEKNANWQQFCLQNRSRPVELISMDNIFAHKPQSTPPL